MKYLKLLLLLALCLPLAGQEPGLVNSNGGGITNPAFRTAVLNGTNVSDTELGYLDGVSSGIQNQFNAKKTDSMSTNRLLGRGTAGTGAIEEITLGTNLSFTGTTLNAAGGTVDNSTVNAALAENPSGSREAMRAETTGIAWLERFGRHANGTQISSGSTTENGNTWFMVNQPGFSYATVTNEALTARPNDLLYIGGTVPCPGKRFSMTAIVELRASTTWVNAQGFPAGLIIGINNVGFTDLSNFLGDGIEGANTQRPIHVSLTNAANINGFYYQPRAGDAGVTEDATRTGFDLPANKKFTINVTVIGDVATFSIAGYTKVFRHAGISDRISESGTGFFVEFSDSAENPQMFVLHDLWVNAPMLDANEASSTRNQLFNEWFRSSQMDVPGNLRVGMQGGFAANQAPLSTADSFGTPGNAMVGYHAYTRPFGTITARLVGTTDRATAIYSSGANVTDFGAVGFTQPDWLITSPNNGAAMKATIYGRFGDTPTAKRIKIFRSGEPVNGLKFDSGSISPQNTAFKMEYLVFRQSNAWRSHTTLDYQLTVGGAAQRVQQFHSSVYFALSDVLAVTGITAGDVIIDYWHRELLPNY